PARALSRNLDFMVTVRYSADPRRVAQSPAKEARGGFLPTAHGFATAPGPTGAHTVFPCNHHPSNKAMLTVRLTTPPGLVGVASGRPEGVTLNRDGGTTSVYR